MISTHLAVLLEYIWILDARNSHRCNGSLNRKFGAMKPQDQTNWNKSHNMSQASKRAPSFSKTKKMWVFFVQPLFLLCFLPKKEQKHGYITGKQLANNTMDFESAPARWTSSLPRRLWVGFQKFAGTLKGEVTAAAGRFFVGEGRCFLWTWISKKNRGQKWPV